MAESLVGHSGWSPLLKEQVLTRTLKEGEAPKWDDDAAASLLVQDYNTARAYLEEQEWMMQWNENDLLYQSPILYNGVDPSQARASRFTVNNQSNTMSDAVRDGMFSEKPPFFMRPRGKTTQNLVDAWTALLDVLLDRMNFRYWTGLGIESQTLDGTGVWKCGWSIRKRVVKKRVPRGQPEQINMPAANTENVNTTESDAFKIVLDIIEESYPWIQNRMLGTTLFDPGWRTPNAPNLSAGYVIDVDYASWHDLEKMRLQGCYDIPDSETLKEFFFHHAGQGAPEGSSIETYLSREGSPVNHAESRGSVTTADPLAQTLLMLERHDESTVITGLCINSRWLIIRNEEHGLGRMPHFAANWRNVKNMGYGMGIGRLVGGDQRIEQGVLNHSLNLLAYQFNPAILHAQGSNAPTQNRVIRAGGFFAVTPIGNDVRNAMAIMDMPKIPAEAWQMIQYIKGSSQETSGADATFMQGQLQGKGSSAARTATGASRIAAKSDGRVQTPVENVELGLFVPFFEMLIDMVKTNMPAKEIRQILSSKLSAEIMDDFNANEFLEADFEVEMLAAAKLAAKAAMAQQLPYLMQIFQQPQLLEQLHNEGKTIDLDVILDILFAVSEYRNEDEIIRDMTDEEKAMVQSMHAPNAKVQEATTVEQIKGQNALQLEDKRAQNKLATDLAEQAMEKDGGGIPLARASSLVDRANDEKILQGQGPSPLAIS